MLCGARSRLTPEHHSQMAKTVEVEPTEEKTVKEESSGEFMCPQRSWTLIPKTLFACSCFTGQHLFIQSLVSTSEACKLSFSFGLSADKDIQDEWLQCSETVLDSYSQNVKQTVKQSVLPKRWMCGYCLYVVALYYYISTARRTILVFHLLPLI